MKSFFLFSLVTIFMITACSLNEFKSADENPQLKAGSVKLPFTNPTVSDIYALSGTVGTQVTYLGNNFVNSDTKFKLGCQFFDRQEAAFVSITNTKAVVNTPAPGKTGDTSGKIFLKD